MVLSQPLSRLRLSVRNMAFSRKTKYLFRWTEPPFWNLLREKSSPSRCCVDLKNAHALIPDGKDRLKNWQNHWFWVNSSRVGGPYVRTEVTSNNAPELLGRDHETVGLLESSVVDLEALNAFLLKFQGDLQFIPITIRDSLSSPCQKYTQGFATPAASIPLHSTTADETPSTGNPFGVPLACFLLPSFLMVRSVWKITKRGFWWVQRSVSLGKEDV
ncbi:unnamed protein product [Lactuca saligna]|uniref:Uncharacterized protein n=1 Tax=Lactuca saligna TaxID=75948 RepID=A0AA36E619_LACSI|nr:unnamed protein product [Lactuca saligna]